MNKSDRKAIYHGFLNFLMMKNLLPLIYKIKGVRCKMQRKVEYKYEEERVSVGDVLRNMMTIGLVVAVMFHFIIQ